MDCEETARSMRGLCVTDVCSNKETSAATCAGSGRLFRIALDEDR